MPRKTSLQRKTKETDIRIELNVDGKGKTEISTPIPFLNHLLDNFGKHGLFDLKIETKGDIEIDQHHTVEDVGISLGEAFKKALGDKKGINRAGYFVFPLDESLSVVAVDISGRAFLNFDCKFKKEKIGDLDSDLIKEFFWGFVRHLEATLHIRVLSGENDHHKAESVFKAFGKAMKIACSKEKRILKELPSTKGLI
ncbi:MAG: imidazoleglycerol-phosphate dehydratase [Candidatus Nealsonbacteria bacterium CG18_big_fil_WC_8_21_14_2_50_37_10]|uniref:Imidazoleglycerol-phosphate dehydratase n=1 Tax=Candidatus Nealsonbacteria bacterium CG18_big_fil_WC_8_21_14_2_50_37_10 TaxID=1974717 RepID=A0A2H0FCW5_9BACT|nr:MAG: imidazoleglycerol-phosphate dehydratase [Candidatus Nealsonbacteria bacterium CG18_big_fil_WC_8_21_14_2_50_37_10]